MVGLREPSEEEIARPGLISCIFNAAANTEKMSKTGLEPKKSSGKNLSRNQRKRDPPNAFAMRPIDPRCECTHPVN